MLEKILAASYINPDVLFGKKRERRIPGGFQSIS
jgi:hypothetical protein